MDIFLRKNFNEIFNNTLNDYSFNNDLSITENVFNLIKDLGKELDIFLSSSKKYSRFLNIKNDKICSLSELICCKFIFEDDNKINNIVYSMYAPPEDAESLINLNIVETNVIKTIQYLLNDNYTGETFLYKNYGDEIITLGDIWEIVYNDETGIPEMSDEKRKHVNITNTFLNIIWDNNGVSTTNDLYPCVNEIINEYNNGNLTINKVAEIIEKYDFQIIEPNIFIDEIKYNDLIDSLSID